MVRLSRDSGMSGSGYLDDGNTGYRGWNNVGPAIPEDYENDPTDPVLINRKVDTKVDKKVYRSERIQRRVIGDSGYGADGSCYPQDEVPIHESRYTTTHTNCQPNPDLLDNGSLGSDPNLVSRNTSSTTTQEVTTVTKVYRTYERVPNETLSSGINSRDYDYPEEYLADYESQLYARPYRKYGSPKRFDYVNGTAHGNATAAAVPTTNGDVFDRSDLYGSTHSTKGSSRKSRPSGPHDDVGLYGSYLSDQLVVGDYSGSPTAEIDGGSRMAPAEHTNGTSSRANSHPHVQPITQYRDPELPEVIEFLRNPSNVIKANAAAHLAHLAFNNDQVKHLTRQLHGIPPLLEMLGSNIPELQRNACSALRNLAFGRENDENKRAVRSSGGLATLIKLLKQTHDNEIGELVTAILWILSSCDELKKPILDEACPMLIKQIIIPRSGYKQRSAHSADAGRPVLYSSTVFRNSSGVLRNVSSAGFQARKTLRESEDFIGALLFILKDAVNNQDNENKSVENVVCILRNLSFRCQEVEDPDYDRKRQPKNKKGNKDKGSASAPGSLNGTPAKNTVYTNLKGMDALWSLESIQAYLNLIQKSANLDTIEAAVGILQNLSACFWQPAMEVRATVRKEKGLPVLVESLRIDNDKVKCTTLRAFRNLAVDQRNRELIGKYAMGDLVQKIPGPPAHPDSHSIVPAVPTSEETMAAALATVNEVVKKHPEFARAFLDYKGVEKLVYITTHYSQYSSKIVRFAFLVLQTLWSHQSLHEVYRSAGFKESHFLSKPPNMGTKTLGGTDTLGRTFSSQGATKFEDKTLPRGMMPDDQDSGVPMNGTSSSRVQSGGGRLSEPVYAQVNRAEKIRLRQMRDNGDGSADMMSEDGMGGDSWV
ncbi:catenin delta-2-like isoform X2 [Paramacrobiotus metropolitanus]|uniref:catenin delta-2-like isoform X2 n=1 Tax=Paramacrobiotus metropolitanus TaxID=2943436 RepID=UPI0024459B58|nr:catenin delta-2-like isoform X2 [Paramacrobiotus metropolitanus]